MSREEAEARVLADWRELEGKRVKVNEVTAYYKDSDSCVPVALDPPVEVLFDQEQSCLMHICDEWQDPIYDITLADPEEPQLAKYRSMYCFGRSHNINTGETQNGDIVAVQQPDGTWKEYK